MTNPSFTELAGRQCVPCKGGVPPLARNERAELERRLGHDWRVAGGHHLEKEFRFADFRTALDFVNRVGEIAEQQQHHPGLFLAWGLVRIQIWTHKIDGLTESDFVLAARIEALERAIVPPA